MSDTQSKTPVSLYPARDSLGQVQDEAIAQLPITSANQIVALLRLHENTMLNIMRGKIDDAS